MIWEQIQEYRRLGFVLIPLDYGTKKPSVVWKQYQETPPTEEDYQRWFNNGEDHNVAVICGKISNNLVVLDFDDPTKIPEFFPKIDPHKETFCVKTNRGEHIYFHTKTPAKKRSIPGIVDVLGEGSLATLPPSKHEKGTVYTSIGMHRMVTLDDFEKTFWAKAESLGYYKKTGIHTNFGTIKHISKDYADYTPPCIQRLLNGMKTGQRNMAAFALTIFLKNAGKTREEITTLLEDWNRKNSPAIEIDELNNTIRSGIENEYGLGCSTSILKNNCEAKKPGECLFLDPVFTIKELTEKIVCTEAKVPGDPKEYEVTIDGKLFFMTTDKMLLPRFFLQRWLEEMDSLLPNMSTKKWSEIVTYWAQNAEKKQADAISVDAYVVDTILEELSRCEVTTSLPMALNEHRYFYAKYRFEEGDKPQKVLYYANKHMKRLIDSTKYKVDLGRIRKLLHPYLAGDSVPIRHKEELNRFWQFKGDLLEIDWKTKFIPDEEEK